MNNSAHFGPRNIHPLSFMDVIMATLTTSYIIPGTYLVHIQHVLSQISDRQHRCSSKVQQRQQKRVQRTGIVPRLLSIACLSSVSNSTMAVRTLLGFREENIRGSFFLNFLTIEDLLKGFSSSSQAIDFWRLNVLLPFISNYINILYG